MKPIDEQLKERLETGEDRLSWKDLRELEKKNWKDDRGTDKSLKQRSTEVQKKWFATVNERPLHPETIEFLKKHGS